MPDQHTKVAPSGAPVPAEFRAQAHGWFRRYARGVAMLDAVTERHRLKMAIFGKEE